MCRRRRSSPVQEGDCGSQYGFGRRRGAAVNVRDPSRRTSSGSCTGEIISLKAGGWMAYESRGELDLLLMLDIDYRTVELNTHSPIAEGDCGSRFGFGSRRAVRP